MHRLIRWFIAVLSIALIAGAPVRGSSEPNQETPAAKRAKVKGRLKQIRGQMLRKRVGLDDATATRVEATFDKYRMERAKQQQRLRTNRKAITTLIKADSNDQVAYARAISESRYADQELVRLRNSQADDLSKILTPKQQAKLAMGLKQLQRRLHSALHRQGEPGHGKGNNGPAPAGDDETFGL